MAPKASTTRHKYIIGLDFGTTYTGVSHVDSTKSSLEDIEVLKNWPGPSKEFDECWKTPSKIAYPQGHSGSTDQEPLWGYQVPCTIESYSWMKLRLDQHTRLTDFDDVYLANLPGSRDGILALPPGKEGFDLCTDFLKCIYKYVMHELERKWGEEIIKVTPIEFWVTHPATWSDGAKQATMNAAMEAGFGTRPGDTMHLITEPEAAAIATLSELVKPGVSSQVHVGDGILICDCGGGTVDLTTYLIKATTPKLEFEELVVGQGAKVGSSFIDRQFHLWLGSHFGKYFEKLDYKRKGPGSRLMKEFESLKRDFGGSRNREEVYEVPLVMDYPDCEYYDREGALVKFTKRNMEAFFNPSVANIKAVLLDQLKKANLEMKGGKKINMIVLCGGYGDSQYLHDNLKKLCAENGGIRLICPNHPQAAIVKGAALAGLGNIQPTSRKCRRHYGFEFMLPFRAGKDPAGLATFDTWGGSKYCKDRMVWKIEKGASIDDQTTIELESKEVYYPGERKVSSGTLYSCSTDSAPEYKDSSSIDTVGEMVFDWSSIPLSQFKSKVRKGKKMYRLDWTYKIHLGAREGVLQVKAFLRNKEVGKANFDFNRTENGLLNAKT